MSGQSLSVSSEFQATPSDQSFLWVPHADRGATSVDVGSRHSGSRGGGGADRAAALHVHGHRVDGGGDGESVIVEVVSGSDEYFWQ